MDYTELPQPPRSTSDFKADEQWDAEYAAVHWIQFVMAALSIIGSSSVIAYAVFQRSVRSPEMRPLFYLSLSDLLLGFCWLIGASLYEKRFENHNIACYNLQTTGQIFYMSSFFYTANYTWQLCTDLKLKISSLASTYPSLVSRIAIILSSVVPFVLMVPAFSVGNANGCYQNYSQPHSHRCLLLHNAVPVNNSTNMEFNLSVCTAVHFYGLGVFLITFVISSLTIVGLLSKACAVYRKYVQTTGLSENQQSILISVAERRAVLYPIAFFYCWAPAVFLAVVKLFFYSEHSAFYTILYVLQAFTATSQGFLNCLVYGWTQNLYCFLKLRACHDATTQTPLLRSQKRQYESTQPAAGKADGRTNMLL